MTSIATLPIGGVDFWSTAVPRRLYSDSGLLYVVLADSSMMRIILRTREELFEETVRRQSRAHSFNVVINGTFYDITSAGLRDAMWGHDPIEAKETIPLGLLINNFRIVGGRHAPNSFFVANIAAPISGYQFGFGDAPAGNPVVSAIGGAGPLIIGGLKYGKGNLYKPGSSPAAPTTGPPSAKDQANLIQRNNNTFIAAAQRPPRTGKTVIAHNSNERKLLIVVQRDGSTVGISLEDLRDKLFDVGVDNAIFLDGSDSSMLMVNNVFHVRQGPNKDETNTIGVGFRQF